MADSIEHRKRMFADAKKAAKKMFEDLAEEGCSKCHDAASYGRWLEDAVVNSRSAYLAHKNPAWASLGPAVDVETGQSWLEPGEAELLAEKQEYERNLELLDSRWLARKQFWMERYAQVHARPSASQTGLAISEPEDVKKPILIRGPDDAEVLFYPLGDYWMWSLRNRSLRQIDEFRLELSTTQSFDFEKGTYREPRRVGFRWPKAQCIEAGDLTKAVILLLVDRDNVRLWNSDANPVLSWPTGDLRRQRDWRLSLRGIGLSTEWAIELCVRWTMGNRTLELQPCPGGCSVFSAAESTSKPPQTRGSNGMEYPREFAKEAINAVEAEIIHSRRAIGEARRMQSLPSHYASYPTDEFEQAFLQSILRVFLVFASHAVELCRVGDWTLDRVDGESREFLRRLTINWRYEEGRDRAGNQIREVSGGFGVARLMRWVEEKFESCPEWTQYEDLLLSAVGKADLPTPPPEDAVLASEPESGWHVDLLGKILERRHITVDTWARDHRIGRTSVFDWKTARRTGASLSGKVSEDKVRAIETAIEGDAIELGLPLGSIRTNSD